MKKRHQFKIEKYKIFFSKTKCNQLTKCKNIFFFEITSFFFKIINFLLTTCNFVTFNFFFCFSYSKRVKIFIFFSRFKSFTISRTRFRVVRFSRICLSRIFFVLIAFAMIFWKTLFASMNDLNFANFLITILKNITRRRNDETSKID